MKWLTDKAASDSVTNTDSTVYSAQYQWGRQTDGHQKRSSATIAVGSVNIADYSNGDGTGQIKSTSTSTDKFITNITVAFVWDWQKTHYDLSDLWGNGVVVGTSTGATPADGNPYDDGDGIKYYQKPVKQPADPCPEGWRVPTQDEWETLGNYCNASSVADNTNGYFPTNSPSSYATVTTVGSGTTTVPINNPNLVWVTVANGLPDASNWSYATPSLKVGGYALYNKTDWDNADAGYKNGTLHLYDADAPRVLLFLPSVGYPQQRRRSGDRRRLQRLLEQYG
ncbi:MAG: fibrobacter succinogenes major paralogous domain-containing protein [Prevotellaceae bacterium]|jgi:uncharacterized protein (TIGR02145 family)|nr:fibrobacter succinogenes major paralogous domain-containing protein [Prevotellaceae bacterium]